MKNRSINSKLQNKKVEQEYLATIRIVKTPSILPRVIGCIPIIINNAATFLINSPGYYCLQSDAPYAPVANSIAITVTSDNVVIDLGNFNLYQTNASANVTAIVLGDLGTQVLKNVTIKNGSIANFTNAGILANNMNTILPFQNLNFFDLNVLECGTHNTSLDASGINLTSNRSHNLYDSSVLTAYNNVRIERCNVNKCYGRGSIQVFTGSNVIIKNCQANNLSSNLDLSIFGYRLVCRDLQMSECQGNNTVSTSVSSINQIGGMSCCYSMNMDVYNCQFNNTYGESGFVTCGMDCSNVQNSIFDKCQFNGTLGGALAALIEGVYMQTDSLQLTQGNGLKFSNCQFNNTSVSSDNLNINVFIAGFSGITVRNIIFDNCQATNIMTISSGFNAYGFYVGTFAENAEPYYANSRNIIFKNCVAADISGTNGSAFGYFMAQGDGNITGQQASLGNTIIENCIAQHIYSNTTYGSVAGIYQGLDMILTNYVYASSYNLLVKNCMITDVKNTNNLASPRSAGILVDTVHKPVIKKNNISDCDRGIQLTGNPLIVPGTLFQLAKSKEDALANPPVAIDLNGAQTYTGGTASQNGQIITGVGTNFVGAVANGTIIFNDGTIATIYQFINNTTLLTVESQIVPNQSFHINYGIPPIAPLQTFTNLNRAGHINISPSNLTVDLLRDYLYSPTDLNMIGWELGDEIVYNSEGGLIINDLVNYNLYYLIVYEPGFVERGIIEYNEVNNCKISGYQDDKSPCTSSTWLNNRAICNGINYVINWSEPEHPIARGSIRKFPEHVKPLDNISIKCGRCDCKYDGDHYCNNKHDNKHNKHKHEKHGKKH